MDPLRMREAMRVLNACSSASSNGGQNSSTFAVLAAGLYQGRAEWRQLDPRIAAFDAEFARMAREDAAARQLATIPGIGVINATALIAALSDARRFARARPVRLAGESSAIRWAAQLARTGAIAPNQQGGDHRSHRIDSEGAVILETSSCSPTGRWRSFRRS
jgi:hypothetical protein